MKIIRLHNPNFQATAQHYLDPPDQPEFCEVCGTADLDKCICPECPKCHSVGDPQCYAEHGLQMSPEQTAAKTAAEKRWAEQNAAEYAAAEEMSKQPAEADIPQPETSRCPHGNKPEDCNACMMESDFQYDAARERSRFGGIVPTGRNVTAARPDPFLPFKLELQQNIMRKIDDLKADDTTGMGLDNLRMVVRTPKSNGPVGTNAQWVYKQMFEEVVRNLPPQYKDFILQ